MEPNSPFQMQYYDQGHGNSNGFPPSYSQSPGMSSPNNSLSSQTPPYAFRGMENGMSRFMADQFDSQNFQQHPNQFYQQQQNMRRNDGNFPYKSQLGSQQGFPNQQGNFVANHDSFSNATYNSFLPSNMKGRMPSDSDMFSSSAQSFSQARQNFTTSVSRVSLESTSYETARIFMSTACRRFDGSLLLDPFSNKSHKNRKYVY